MANNQNSKPPYNLEERTFIFAKDVRNFIKTLPNSSANFEDGKQIIKSSGSVGTNYREANEALRKKRLCLKNKNLQKGSNGKRLLVEVN